MSDHVFVCYVREDQDFVLGLANRLKGRGVPVWLDRWHIPPGANWNRAIDAAILECSRFLIVLSPDAVDSGEVMGELFMALDARKPIVPVVHRKCMIPRQLRPIQHLDYVEHGPDDDPPLGGLVTALGGGRAAETPVAPPAATAPPPAKGGPLFEALNTSPLVRPRWLAPPAPPKRLYETQRPGDLSTLKPVVPPVRGGQRVSTPTTPPPQVRQPTGPPPAAAPPRTDEAGDLVAKVIHYYERLGVAGFHAVAAVHVGDLLRFQGASTAFVQLVSSLERDRRAVQAAEAGTQATLKVSAPVRRGDRVYRLALGQYLLDLEQALGISRQKGEVLIGLVERYYPRAGAAAVIVGPHRVAKGSRLHIRGAATDLRQDVESLQRDRKPLMRVDGPATIGLAVSGPVRTGDLVYKE